MFMLCSLVHKKDKRGGSLARAMGFSGEPVKRYNQTPKLCFHICIKQGWKTAAWHIYISDPWYMNTNILSPCRSRNPQACRWVLGPGRVGGLVLPSYHIFSWTAGHLLYAVLNPCLTLPWKVLSWGHLVLGPVTCTLKSNLYLSWWAGKDSL